MTAMTDTNAWLADVTDRVTEAFNAIAATLADFARQTVNALQPLAIFVDSFVDSCVPRYAVERMGVTEVDIRSWTSTEVRLWNGRRLPVDRAAVIAWLRDRDPSVA